MSTRLPAAAVDRGYMVGTLEFIGQDDKTIHKKQPLRPVIIRFGNGCFYLLSQFLAAFIGRGDAIRVKSIL